MPLHAWLPRAHPIAPAQLSALMSGVMIKVAIYGLVRVEFEWLGVPPRWFGLALLATRPGLFARRRGVRALPARAEAAAGVSLDRERRDHRARPRRVAAVRARAARTWAAFALAAALLHTLNHAVFKALLFLGAGAFERAVGALELDRLGGLLRRMPWTGGAFLVGCDGDRRAAAAERVRLGVADAAGAAARPVPSAARRRARRRGRARGARRDGGARGVLLRQGRRARAARPAAARQSARRRSSRPAGCASAWRRSPVLCVVLGLVPGLGPADARRPGSVAGRRRAGAEPVCILPGTGSLPPLAIALALAGTRRGLSRLRGRRRAAPAPSWACGQLVEPALSWTSAGFTKPLRLVLEAVLRPQREIEVVRERRGGRRASPTRATSRT